MMESYWSPPRQKAQITQQNNAGWGGGGNGPDPRPMAPQMQQSSNQQPSIGAFPQPQPQPQPPIQQQSPPQLMGTGGQFGGAYQNPQMDPWKQKSRMMDQSNVWGGNQGMNQKPEDWRLGGTNDPIPGSVWGSMGLWSRGGW